MDVLITGFLLGSLLLDGFVDSVSSPIRYHSPRFCCTSMPWVCLPLRKICDGKMDCQDASDEQDVCRQFSNFATSRGLVVPAAGTDYKQKVFCCPQNPPVLGKETTTHKRLSASSLRCIPAIYVCDGESDCEPVQTDQGLIGADEYNCNQRMSSVSIANVSTTATPATSEDPSLESGNVTSTSTFSTSGDLADGKVSAAALLNELPAFGLISKQEIVVELTVPPTSTGTSSTASMAITSQDAVPPHRYSSEEINALSADELNELLQMPNQTRVWTFFLNKFSSKMNYTLDKVADNIVSVERPLTNVHGNASRGPLVEETCCGGRESSTAVQHTMDGVRGATPMEHLSDSPPTQLTAAVPSSTYLFTPLYLDAVPTETSPSSTTAMPANVLESDDSQLLPTSTMQSGSYDATEVASKVKKLLITTSLTDVTELYTLNSNDGYIPDTSESTIWTTTADFFSPLAASEELSPSSNQPEEQTSSDIATLRTSDALPSSSMTTDAATHPTELAAGTITLPSAGLEDPDIIPVQLKTFQTGEDPYWREFLGPRPDLCRNINGNLRAPDCRYYIICLKNHAVAAKCPAGFVFNPTVRQCDWPINVLSCLP